MNLAPVRQALADYDVASGRIDAYVGSDSQVAEALFASYEAALMGVAVAFADATADRNDRDLVISAITQNGRATAHYGSTLDWVRRLVA